MKRSTPPRLCALLIAVLLSMNGFALVLPAIAARSSPSDYVHLPSDLSSLLNASKPEGFPAPGSKMDVTFTLPTRNAQGLAQFLKDVNNPSSPYYHKFLSSSLYSKLFGPDGNELLALEAYLQSNGLNVTYGGVGASGINNPNLYALKASGTIQQVEQALNTKIQQFNYNGTSFFSATSPPSLPRQFSNVVKVGGLSSQALQTSSVSRFNAVPLYRTLHQLVNKPSQNSENFMVYSPSEIEGMYNITGLHNAGINGAGVTIAIVDAYGYPNVQGDLNQFDAMFGIANTTVNQICVDGPCYNSDNGWGTEIALDVEWAHALAPNATINLYIGSNSGQALYDAVEAAVMGTNGTSPYSPSSIISMSWGIPENDIGSSAPVAPFGFGENYPWLNQVFQQATAQGITLFAATGDWGAYDQAFGQDSPYGGAIYPSTDPFVTAVGGTSLYGDASNGLYQYPYMNATTAYGNETAWSWNNFYDWATGGGCSTIFGAQSWENGVSTCGSQRGVPDVAWDADVQTGVVVVNSGGSEIVGGTSVGAPSWAGSMALIDQAAGRSMGWINPTIYGLNASDLARSFHDVTTGNNNPTSASVGWDQLTGLGSPNVGNLAQVLSDSNALSVKVSLGSGTPVVPLALGQSLGNGSVLSIRADVTNGGVNVTEGDVTAYLFSPSDVPEGTVDLSYNSTLELWNATFSVWSSVPPGEWTVEVDALNGTSSGSGYATLPIGDGITLGPDTCFGCQYYRGDTIWVYASVNATDGSPVTSGNYWAAFNYEGPNGKLEGNISLSYSWGDQQWEGAFVIPMSADQGPWTMTVGGADSSWNFAKTYTWLNVGLVFTPETDSPTYLQGDVMQIAAYTGAPGGTFNATVMNGENGVGSTPMTFAGPYDEGFYGQIALSSPLALGFDNVTVSGGDHFGYAGFGSTIVRVAPDSLGVSASFSKANIPVNDESCVYDNNSEYYNCGQMVMAHITYPGGATVTQGNVYAYLSLDGPSQQLSMEQVPLTFNSTTGDFIGMLEVPANGPSPYLPAVGNYTAQIEAYDPAGNYGNGQSTFYVSPLPHAPIFIDDKADFNATSGVVFGNGNATDPFVIEGWKTSSIDITGAMNSTYLVIDNVVTGGVGDGLTLNTWNLSATGSPSVFWDFEIGNGLNGLHVYNFPNAVVAENFAANNAGDGMKIDSSPGARVYSAQSANNGANGIEYLNSWNSGSEGSYVTGNQFNGILLIDSPGSGMGNNFAYFNNVGINDTGSDFGGFNNNLMGNNIGEFINGLWQQPEEDAVHAAPRDGGLYYSELEDEYAAGNGIGLLALNNSLVYNYDSYYYANTRGVLSNSSSILLDENAEVYNTYSGIALNGMPTDGATVYPECGDWEESSWTSVVDCNFAYQNGYGIVDPAPNAVAANMYGVLFIDNEGYYSAGTDTQFINMTDSGIAFTTASGSGGDGFGGMNPQDDLFIVASTPYIYCQDVCDFIVPAAAGNGLNIVNGLENEVAESYLYGNGLNGFVFANSFENEMGMVASYNNGGQGISVSNSAYIWMFDADVENNLGTGVQITSSNYTQLVESYVINNSMTSPVPSYNINIDPSSTFATVADNVINYSWAGVGSILTTNDTVVDNLICHTYVGIYVDGSVNGTYAPNNFCSNTINTWTAPPVDESYLIIATGTQDVGVTHAFYATVENQLLYKPSAIVWFEVDNQANQVVMVAGVSPDVAPLSTGNVYLALGPLAPGNYHIRAFAVTDVGVPLSNVVITPETVS